MVRWEGRRQSENVEDRRGMRGPVAVAGGGGLMILVILILSMVFGFDPRPLLQQVPQGAPQQAGGGEEQPIDPSQEKLAAYVKTILADTEDVWTDLFRQAGREYKQPTLVLFNGQVQSACGTASAAVGPFYCPLDQKLYIDLKFYQELEDRFEAPGDFAQAYVIAHEVGHHVQNLLGTMNEFERAKRGLSPEEANALSVRLELQADFYAGVWAHHAQQKFNMLERGDINEGLTAASAIGDDNIQRSQQGFVVPDSFTHGSADQRVRWFRKGLETGDMRQGDTFNAREL